MGQIAYFFQKNVDFFLSACYNDARNYERSYAMPKKENSELFTSILYIIVGVILAIFQGDTLNWAMTIAGAFFVISGILEIVKKNYSGGGISLVIGIAILVLGWLLTEIVLIVLGVLIAIKGAVALIEVFKKETKNALELVFPILTVVLGIALAFGGLADTIILIVGILLAIDGVLGLISVVKKS